MNELNYLYVKVQEFISQAKDIKELAPILKKIGRLSPKDTFTRVKNEIIIEDDWIKFAESKMKYVEAAVYENRQFIREDGEVLPIDRVKKIGRNSVEHLARHSDYIDKFDQETEEIVPGKIYTVNKDTDYGVYENKFLYLLLMTLSDFVARERDEISTSLKQESGVFSIIRQNELNEDDVALDIKMSFKSVDSDNDLPEEEKDKLIRMENLRGRAGALLSTPLMQIVSKEPMISSSITKTNVLTMNENFSNSLELYEMLINYEKKSYSCKRTVEPIVVQSEFSYPILALELLVQILKNDELDSFDRTKKEIESNLRKQAIDAINKRIEELKSKYQDNPAEYIMVLEDKINLLGELNIEIADLRKDLNDMTKAKEALEVEKSHLEAKIDILNEKISELQITIGNFEQDKEEALSDADKKIKEQEDTINTITGTVKEREKEIKSLLVDKDKLTNKAEALEDENKDLSSKLDTVSKDYADLKASYDEEMAKKDEELRLLKARLTGIQAEAGELKPEDADTKKEAFDELEREYNSFTAYFEAVWELTKKEIKKEIKNEVKRKKG